MQTYANINCIAHTDKLIAKLAGLKCFNQILVDFRMYSDPSKRALLKEVKLRIKVKKI